MLVYTPHITARIAYILQYFNEQVFIKAEHTADLEQYKLYLGPKLNYSTQRIDPSEIFIFSSGLLHQQDIRKQYITCFEWEGTTAFYQTEDDLGFDLFAAVFYLLSRYEEYLGHEPDEYGRYAHWNSLAWKAGFLQKPLIDCWLQQFKLLLEKKFQGHPFKTSTYQFVPTYDIDIAWSYQGKGFLRNLVAAIAKPSTIAQRIRVTSGKAKDPFDAYAWMQEVQTQYQLQPIYFFLVAAESSLYDKNISPRKKILQNLIQSTATHATIGLHPSTQSNVNKELLVAEKKGLEQVLRKPIRFTRYHYILFHLPHSYRELIAAEVTDDYSMGYGTVNGFRASTAKSFLWFDLEKDVTSSLRIHPYAYMEANSFYELKHSPEQALEEMNTLNEAVKNTGGVFMSIFHNHMLGTDPMFEGWREMYAAFLSNLPAVSTSI